MPAASALQRFNLENGLAVYLREDHRSSLVSAQLWYHVGSSQEPSGQSGLCHLVEHLMFEGSSKLGPGQYNEIMQRLGGNPNAFTTADATCFPITLPASRLEVALEIMADSMASATLGEPVFKRELDIVKAERRQRVDNRPLEVASERALILANSNTPYADPPIGYPADLQHLDISAVRSWYQNWYQPNNASLVVAGAIDMPALRTLVERHFAGIAAAPLPQRWAPPSTRHFAHRSQTIALPSLPKGAILAFNTPSLATADHPGHAYALRLIPQLLANGSSSRLFLRRVRGDQSLLQAEAGYQHLQRGDSLLTLSLYANPATATAKSATAAALEEIADLRHAAPAEDELQRAKNRLLADLVFARENVEAQAEAIGQHAVCGIDPGMLEQEHHGIRSVTAEEVRVAADTFLTHERLTITYLDDVGDAEQETAGSPPQPPTLASLQTLDMSTLDLPVPKVQAWQTAEGAVARLVQSHEQPMLDLMLSFNAGSRLDGDKPGLAAMTLFMLDEGTLELEAGAFAEHMEKLGAQYSKSITRDQTHIHLRCLTNETLTPALNLIIDMVARPAFRAGEFELMKAHLLESNRQTQAIPMRKAQHAALSLAFGEHPYGSPERGTNAGIALITPEDVRHFHRRAYSASNLEISMVGDISREAAEALTRRICAALPQHWAAAEPPALPSFKAAVASVEQPGVNHAVMLLLPMRASRADADYPALVLANDVLGHGPDSRLFKELRQRLGLTYGVYSSLAPDTNMLYIQGEVAAEYLDAFTRQLGRVLQDYAAKGPGEDELELARQALLGDLRRALANNGSLVELIATLHAGLPADALQTYIERVLAVTPEAAHLAFKLRLELASQILVSVGPTVDQQALPTGILADQ
ncbi:M16 family metallopeptidase [Pseudomonas sp. NPDC089401]|uniref:M16 family metallopeptidase n=1 Tax=Pseudomonas sp. NPDC089401 TaxID=3364462 RepID=UPI00381237FE